MGNESGQSEKERKFDKSSEDERERSGLAERERQDAEKAADIKARQVRLGDVPEESEEASREQSN